MDRLDQLLEKGKAHFEKKKTVKAPEVKPKK
jgi:hypothetical protein